ncbi:hypothetical protein Moror_7743 [Moniliophthora roreri MCA 2997]|uniref:DUF7598 domain-containing protein n=2 Tax=Moniliophthora roreri TaxID=221103 RepID=V2YEV7_MONRO|nr:hypothetical protein Moror_7743 [Moniliophthora roreri MCA 2997]KAI3615252.1 hypothetical protein WG66_003597 [Moniliophthora roreri]
MVPPRAYIFFGLNAVRFLSIISLILVFASGIFVMATNIQAVNAFEAAKINSTAEDLMTDCDYIENSTVPNQPAGVFWAVVSSLLVIFQVIVLLLSECSWPMPFFDRFFPVLGSNFGLGALGIFQCLIGAQILSHHVDDFTLVAAFLLFSIGCLNMLLGLIFRESAKEKRSIRSWRANSKSILPTTAKDGGPIFVNASPAFASSTPQLASEFGSFRSTDKAGYGFGRQGEKAAGLRGFILQKPDETLPRYATPTPAATPTVVSLDRPKSSRTSTSSFASPEHARDSVHNDEADDKDNRPQFKSSPTSL